MGGAILTLLSFQLPAINTQNNNYLPIDTTLGGIDLVDSKIVDFDSENL